MRRNWTKHVRALFFASLFLCLSCQDDPAEQSLSSQKHPVGFHAGGAATRTEILSNGLSAAWESGDELAVWAINSSGSYVLSKQIFRTYGLDVQRGFFTSDLSAEMPDDTYSYLCCYPVPTSVNGTDVTFTLPALQDGKASGGADIMIATPVTHGPLTAVPDPEDHSGMSMQMNRMMHQFRFYVPEDNTVLGDSGLEKIILTFPSAVVGTVTLDVAAPGTTAVLSDGESQLTLIPTAPLTVSPAEEPMYACVVIAPSSFSEGESLGIKAYTATQIAELDPVDLCARTFEAGHSTPVKLNVKTLKDYSGKIIFTLSGNNLGEDINTIRFEAPSGCIWPESGTNVYEYTPGYGMTTGEVVTINFESIDQYKAFSDKDIAITFDSDHALMKASAHIAAIASDVETGVSEISASVPYLFSEDFSSLTTYNGDYDAGPHTSTSGASIDAIELSSYGLASGWTGARTGCTTAGTSILVGGRVDCVIAGATRSYGRLESPALSNLKSGVSVDVSVSFDYSGSRKDASMYYPVGVCGFVETSGLLNGYATQFNNSVAWEGILGYETIPDIPTSGNASTMAKSYTYKIDGCTSNCRLSWHVVGMGYESWKINNGLQYLYLDNIKVQIAK